VAIAAAQEAALNEIKGVKTVEQIQEMIQKREVAVDLLVDGAVRRKLLAELVELRKSGTQSIELAQRLTDGRGQTHARTGT
jgi:hypothetical protein